MNTQSVAEKPLPKFKVGQKVFYTATPGNFNGITKTFTITDITSFSDGSVSYSLENGPNANEENLKLSKISAIIDPLRSFYNKDKFEVNDFIYNKTGDTYKVKKVYPGTNKYDIWSIQPNGNPGTLGKNGENGDDYTKTPPSKPWFSNGTGGKRKSSKKKRTRKSKRNKKSKTRRRR